MNGRLYTADIKKIQVWLLYHVLDVDITHSFIYTSRSRLNSLKLLYFEENIRIIYRKSKPKRTYSKQWQS